MNHELSLWPVVDELSLGTKILVFRKRVIAITAVIHGASCADAANLSKIGARQISRLVARCLSQHPDGRIWGFRAAVPHIRLKPHCASRLSTRSRTPFGGHTGQLGYVFLAHPKICDALTAYLLKRRRQRSSLAVTRVPLKQLHRIFLDLAEAAGIPISHYPFCTDTRGKCALGAWARKIWHAHYLEATRAHLGEEAARMLQYSGKGQRETEIIPWACVQFDAYEVNAYFSIDVPVMVGGYVTVVVEKIWLLVIIDSASRAIIGWTLSLSRLYTSDDVLATIECAIRPATRRKLSIPKLEYPEHGGLPSAEIPGCAWAVFAEFAADNALAHTSHDVLAALKMIGATLNTGRARLPQSRPLIENFFSYLSVHEVQRLPSTTATTGKTRRSAKDAQNAAVKYRIKLEHLFDLAEVLVARHNAELNGGIQYHRPLDFVRQSLERGQVLKQLPEAERESFSLFSKRVIRVVRGSLEKARRPYIHLFGVRYTSPLLANKPALLGQPLTLVINLRDLRTVRAFTADGAEFDVLQALGGWSLSPHDLRTRRLILRMKLQKQIEYCDNQDPVLILLEHAAGSAIQCKQSAKLYASTYLLVHGTLPPDALSAGAQSAPQEARRDDGVAPMPPAPTPAQPGPVEDPAPTSVDLDWVIVPQQTPMPAAKAARVITPR